MKLLLDTSALLWWTMGDPRLGSRTRQTLEHTFQQRTIYLSAITAWEIGLKQERGKLLLPQPADAFLDAVTAIGGLRWLSLTRDDALASTRLPNLDHKDPADRMILAMARRRNLMLLTSDGVLLDYAAAGHVAAFDLRQ